MTDQKNDDVLFEAPASATCHVLSAAGFEWLITTRSQEMSDVLTRVKQMENFFVDNGWRPSASRPASNNGQANGNVGHSDAPMCPAHNRPMKPSNHGGFFCTVKVADSGGGQDGTKPIYCKATVK